MIPKINAERISIMPLNYVLTSIIKEYALWAKSAKKHTL